MSKKYALFGKDRIRVTQLIKGVHAIPEEAVSISDELFQRMVQECDGIWLLDADNQITKEPLPETVPDHSRIERLWRDKQIESVKWLRERHRDETDMKVTPTLSTAQFTELLIYIQRLRDWPESEDFPIRVKRPTGPQWVEDQIP